MGIIDRLTKAYEALGQKQFSSPLTDYYPNLRYREHVTAGKTTTGGAEIDRYLAHAQIYRQYAWVRRAISAITTAVAPLPRIVVDANAQPIEDHPLTLLLRQPNVTHDGAEFTEILLIHKLLGGEWFAEVVEDARGNPAELWPRRPDEVWVVGAVFDSAYPIPAFYQVPLLDPPVIDANSMIWSGTWMQSARALHILASRTLWLRMRKMKLLECLRHRPKPNPRDRSRGETS